MEEKKILHVLGTVDAWGMVVSLAGNGMKIDCAVSVQEKKEYENELKKAGCSVLHLTKRSEDFRQHRQDLYQIILENGYDIVHIHTQNAFLACMYAKEARKAGVKRILVQCYCSADGSGMDWKGKLLHQLFRKKARDAADVCVACSTEAGRWLFGTEKGVVTVPVPVDCRRFQPEVIVRNKERWKMGFQHSDHVLVSVGESGQDVLIDAMEEILKQDKSYYLLLAGDEKAFSEIKEKVKENGLEEHVFFLGAVPDIERVFNMSDIFLFPSTSGGSPAVILEAAASGLPCLISGAVTKDMDKLYSVRRVPAAGGWTKKILAMETPGSYEKEEMHSEIEETYSVEKVQELLERLYFIDPEDGGNAAEEPKKEKKTKKFWKLLLRLGSFGMDMDEEEDEDEDDTLEDVENAEEGAAGPEEETQAEDSRPEENAELEDMPCSESEGEISKSDDSNTEADDQKA